MTENIIKTEIKLSEESVREIVVAETTKRLAEIPGFIEGIVHHALTYRKKKRYSSDPDNPTYFEKIIQESLQPMIKEECLSLSESARPTVRKILKKALKTKVIDNKEFETEIIKQMARFTSNINFYVSSDE